MELSSRHEGHQHVLGRMLDIVSAISFIHWVATNNNEKEACAVSVCERGDVVLLCERVRDNCHPWLALHKRLEQTVVFHVGIVS